MTYNHKVMKLELDGEHEAHAFNPEQTDMEDTTKKFIFKPGQQIVGIYGKLDKHHDDISWFNFIVAKPNWQGMGSEALQL